MAFLGIMARCWLQLLSDLLYLFIRRNSALDTPSFILKFFCVNLVPRAYSVTMCKNSYASIIIPGVYRYCQYALSPYAMPITVSLSLLFPAFVPDQALPAGTHLIFMTCMNSSLRASPISATKSPMLSTSLTPSPCANSHASLESIRT